MFGSQESPVIIIDTQGRVVASNRRGSELLNTGEFVQRRGDLFVCADEASDSNLRSAIRAARQAADDSHHLISAAEGAGARRITGRRQLGVSVSTLASAARDPASSLTLLTFKHVPQSNLDLAGNAMQCFGLTTAQAKVAAELASGKTIKQIAFYSGVSVNTVRHHVKAIFAKTGTNRQVELVQVLGRMVQGARPPAVTLPSTAMH